MLSTSLFTIHLYRLELLNFGPDAVVVDNVECKHTDTHARILAHRSVLLIAGLKFVLLLKDMTRA
jgi:hypothetical protein